MILIPFYPKISVKCVKCGTASSPIVSVVLALYNILRNFFTISRLPDLYTSFDVIGCTYFLRFHSVLLQVVNESVCLNDEGKYCENESGCLQHATK